MDKPKQLRDYARQNREGMTDAERALWRNLRGSATGYRFRRQQPVGFFILDFYCASARLAVELDGAGHSELADYDSERTARLATENILVIRFTNNEVLSDIASVLEKIVTACQAREGHRY